MSSCCFFAQALLSACLCRRRTSRMRPLDENERSLYQCVTPKWSGFTISYLGVCVAQKLTKSWAPQQSDGWLKRTFSHDEAYQVSHETIYRTLYIQARGALKKEPLQHLRRTRATRRARHFTHKTGTRGRIVDAVSISVTARVG
ncbi:MAG: hypothetical protein ACI9DC_004421 [Gammaproteobacteria bacterium]